MRRPTLAFVALLAGACARGPDRAESVATRAPDAAVTLTLAETDARPRDEVSRGTRSRRSRRPPDPDLEPISGEWIVDVGGDVVSPPVGATEPRPVVIAVHGAGDRPDWACSEWRAIFGPRPFVVCPRGAPTGGGGFVWHSADALEKAIARATSQVEAKYAPYLAAGPRVYAGFSQGAILGASIVERAPETYPYAVFLEGLGDVAATHFARSFATRGGRRILLACSQAGCEAPRNAAKRTLERGGIEARVVYAGNIGHTVNGDVIAAMREALPWLLEGAKGWTL